MNKKETKAEAQADDLDSEQDWSMELEAECGPQAELAEDIVRRLQTGEDSKYKAKYTYAQETILDYQRRERAWLDTSKYVEPLEIEPTRLHGDDAVAVMVASDWHVEERVAKATINGLNEYSPDIAEGRAKKYFDNSLKLIRKERGGAKIEKLVLWLGGDFITGYIHEELMEGNYMSPTEAVLFSTRLIEGGINFLLNHGDFKSVHIPCSFGNHGRSSLKRRVATAAANSYEWLMYRHLADRYANEPRVQFHIADGYLLYSKVYETRIRWHHGDNVRYQGGVGGLAVPLSKAISKWNSEKRVDLDVIGHWHQLQYLPNAVVNGALIGYGPYAQSIKATYEPPSQAMFLVAKDYGPVCFNKVFVA